MKPERLIAEIARVYETLPRTITGQRRHAGIMPARRACDGAAPHDRDARATVRAAHAREGGGARMAWR